MMNTERFTLGVSSVSYNDIIYYYLQHYFIKLTFKGFIQLYSSISTSKGTCSNVSKYYSRRAAVWYKNLLNIGIK